MQWRLLPLVDVSSQAKSLFLTKFVIGLLVGANNRQVRIWRQIIDKIGRENCRFETKAVDYACKSRLGPAEIGHSADTFSDRN